MCKSTELKSRSLFLKSATWRDRDLINAGTQHSRSISFENSTRVPLSHYSFNGVGCVEITYTEPGSVIELYLGRKSRKINSLRVCGGQPLKSITLMQY